MKNTQTAFTLVELSIVLVILGLLVGGVLAGQSLIRSSELRSIIKERDQFLVAINAFKGKYIALPGDMPNAFQFWGATCGTNTTTASTGCNGDGNGYIAGGGGGEYLFVWEHLALAGLIEGNYNGSDAASGANPLLEPENSPKSKFATSYWALSTSPFESGASTGVLVSENIMVLALGLVGSADPAWLRPGSITHAEAWNVDTKVDDGRSFTGQMRGDNSAGCEDVGADYYNLSANADVANVCIPSFIIR